MRFLLIIIAAVIGSSVFGQSTGPDVPELLRRWVQAEKANTEKTRQYAHREYIVNQQTDKQSKVDRKTETWDVIGLEGSTYRKLIQRNDQPLDPKEQRA